MASSSSVLSLCYSNCEIEALTSSGCEITVSGRGRIVGECFSFHPSLLSPLLHTTYTSFLLSQTSTPFTRKVYQDSRRKPSFHRLYNGFVPSLSSLIFRMIKNFIVRTHQLSFVRSFLVACD